MKRATVIAIALIALLMGISAVEALGIPQLITVQGKVRNATTLDALYGAYEINLSIWTASSGGTFMYNETHNVTTDQFGIFNVLMGSTNTLDLAFDRQYYLEIDVNSSTLSPRHTMTSAPYAYNLDCDGCINATDIADDNITFEKMNCVNATWDMGAAAANVAINISGVCDDLDGCTIRIYNREGVILNQPDEGWGYYIGYGIGGTGGIFSFIGFENGSSVIEHTGTTSDATSDIIVVATNACMLWDSGGNPCAATDPSSFCLQSVEGEGTCYIWICD